MKQEMTRRELLKAAALIGISPFITIGSIKALASSPQLDPENAQAKALEYSHQSSIAERNCGNCRLYTGDASQDWGPCAIFPGQNVASAGWCKAWVAEG
ncbi:MAG: hypothetical protein ACI9V8_001129 [Urechidicola sp.]|jgi:hypothetical protein